MKKNKVLCLYPASEAVRAALHEAAPGAEIVFASRDSVTLEDARKFDAILGNPPAEWLSQLEGLRWLQLQSAGAENYAAQMPRGAVLTNATGAYGLAISEYMIAAALMLMKGLHLYRDNQRQGLWKDEGKVGSFQGATVLSVGMGDIGGQFAQRAHALGARVLGIRRTPHPAPDYVEALGTLEDLEAFLPQADVVALSLPGGEQTRHVMNEKRIGLMKRGALLLNVGRGGAVDTGALCRALREGRIGGAALDVTDPEPLPPGHELYGLRNALITPHISGGDHLLQTTQAIEAIFIENLGRFERGEALTHQVDLATGYMKSEG